MKKLLGTLLMVLGTATMVWAATFGAATFKGDVAIDTGKDLTIGSTQWNTSDDIDGNQLGADTVQTAGINWQGIESAELQEEGINWQDLFNEEIQTGGVNWQSLYSDEIQTDAVNWISIQAAELQEEGLNWQSLYNDEIQDEGVNWQSVDGADIQTEGMNWQSLFSEEVQVDGINWQSVQAQQIFTQGINWQDIDSPADEECLTYEDTGSGIEWQDCGGAEDDVYAAGWDGDSDAPSKNTVYDKIELVIAGASAGGTSVNTTPTPDVVHPTDVTHDVTIGGINWQTAPFHFDASAETLFAREGFKVGDATDNDVTIITVDLDASDPTIQWDDTNQEFDFSAPINASGSGPSALGQGLTVNDSSGGTADDDFIAETDSYATALQVDASEDSVVLTVPTFTIVAGSLNANAIKTGDINWQDIQTQQIFTQGINWQDIDTPADEECATYEATGAGIEWQSCGSPAVAKDIVTTSPLTVNAGANLDDVIIGADADITFAIAADTITKAHLVDTFITDTKCITIETPTDADNFLMYHVEVGSQMTAGHCIVEDATSATISIEQCDVAGDNCTDMTSNIVCDVGGQADDGTIDAPDMDVDDWIRVDVTATDGTPGHVTVCLSFTLDD